MPSDFYKYRPARLFVPEEPRPHNLPPGKPEPVKPYQEPAIEDWSFVTPDNWLTVPANVLLRLKRQCPDRYQELKRAAQERGQLPK